MADKVLLTALRYSLSLQIILLGLSKLALSENSSSVDCPPWFFHNSTTHQCQCYHSDLSDKEIRCTTSGVLVGAGYCMTSGKNEGMYFAKCYYFQMPNRSATTNNGYFFLPSSASEVNDYMCGPMNRKGLVCGECIDGFGPSATSVAYICSNCSSLWSGVLLYIIVEFGPSTIFYFVVLTFRINMTYAPMTCFVWYSQLVVCALLKDTTELNELLAQSHSGSSGYIMMFVGLLFGIWNLDTLKYILPPFCISRKLKIIHIELLECFSAFYPLFLIFLTWVCVELHGHNFRPVVLLWKPFHRCFVSLRKRFDTKKDIVDAFVTFLLLAYSKLTYQSVQFLGSQYIIKNGLPYRKVHLYDPTVTYMGSEHLPFVVVSVVILIVLVIPPPFILLLYPTKAFSACLSKCRLNGRFGMVLHTFVEKFYGCYKDGSDGGWDMRCFSALYFLMRPMVVILYVIHLKNLCDQTWFFAIVMFTSVSMLIAFLKPYKKGYMNIFDTLLLADIALLSLLTSTPFRNTFLLSISEVVLLLSPVVILVIFIFNVTCIRTNFLFGSCHKIVNCLRKMSILSHKTGERQHLLSAYLQ